MLTLLTTSMILEGNFNDVSSIGSCKPTVSV